ncbi:zinc finger protein on ecdysone puffs-like isoform X1 [Zophobas morio]|uniref:zinc finger protein on ecdysone puffs-like isoform X1 n=1 Tax=Zophobas morio TaxID=2755281 RepID=UPI0030833F76
MANRRLGGGMGGPQRGNRSFSSHQPFQGNNVSPWQGNMPSNNSLNQSGGLLGQLAANPQQLALALTNLLQPQQQQMNNPPSLLSLNTSPAFSHQDSRDSFNRFGNRGRSDFRRNEPYNKNRNGGWRQLDSNKNLGPNRPRPNFQQRDNRKRSPIKPKFIKDVKDDKRKIEKKDEKTKDDKIDTIDLSTEDIRDDDGEETKRGWKEEKKGDEKKDDDGQDDGEDDKKEEARDLDGKYYGVPQKFLHCFVCSKDMWDGESFEKHIRGRAHKQMLTSLEESFHITVNILRENMRLAEEKKVIELNRMRRLSKNKFNRKFQEPESHCNMCDLKFLGKIITHRKTEGHQRLKRFLHPNCDICGKEFPSRMDWVDHRLTPEHLRQLNETLEGKVGEEDGEIIEEDLEMDLEPVLEETMELEDEHPILELTDELNNLQNRIPAFRKNRPIGSQSLKPFNGFMCDICNRSFENDEFAQAHLRTEGHYYTFVEAVKQKFKKQQEESAKEAEYKKRKRDEEETVEKEETNEETQNGNDGTNMYDPEEACNEEEEAAKEPEEEEEEEEQPAEKEPEQPAPAATPAPAAEPKKEEPVQQTPPQQQPAAQPQQQQPQTQQNTNASPRTRRSAVGGAVKNGAGPKSKKARKQ